MFPSAPYKILDELSAEVGNTPLLELTYRYRNGPEQQILVKDERQNQLTGSIKDRMALYILQKAYAEKAIMPGDTIVEATSGNTGIAFARIGQLTGHPVRIMMPDWMSEERQELIRNYGAQINLISPEQGGFLGSIRMTKITGHDERVFLPKQFENKYNAEAHEKSTGPEIDRLLLRNAIKPAAFVAGVGTGGTVMGIGKYLRSLYPQLKIHPLEPAESPTLSVGHKVGRHRIQGISDEFIPAIVELATLDRVIQVNDGDAILMAQRLAAELELGVGISSGANLLGAIKVQQDLPKGSVVVTVFPDGNRLYLSTDLFKTEPARYSYLSPDIRLLQYRMLK